MKKAAATPPARSHADMRPPRARTRAHLAVGEALQAEPLDELVDANRRGQVILVAKDERGNALEGGLGEQVVQLALRGRNVLGVRRVDQRQSFLLWVQRMQPPPRTFAAVD